MSRKFWCGSGSSDSSDIESAHSSDTSQACKHQSHDSHTNPEVCRRVSWLGLNEPIGEGSNDDKMAAFQFSVSSDTHAHQNSKKDHNQQKTKNSMLDEASCRLVDARENVNEQPSTKQLLKKSFKANLAGVDCIVFYDAVTEESVDESASTETLFAQARQREHDGEIAALKSTERCADKCIEWDAETLQNTRRNSSENFRMTRQEAAIKRIEEQGDDNADQMVAFYECDSTA